MSADPGRSPVPFAPDGVRVAFCPAPPLLLPAVEGTPDAATAALRAACVDAVTAVLGAEPEVVVVVGAGPAAGLRFGDGDAGDLRGFGVDLELPFSGRVRPGGRRVPLPHLLGAWLLDQAGHAGVRVGVGPDDLPGLVRSLPGRVGVLAMGDGSARRSVKAPGHLDPAAEPFDAAVAGALGRGDAAALAALDAAEGERLLAAGVPVWRAVGRALADRAVVASLRAATAPLGVGYLVADWAVR
ncbi:hypothetical protein JKP75_13380 [Blastococcus sp. TML/M2B]|uniref:hypothetical protein n=1 Tax=unclassified Blastococcus TaxID=2619396 RepID=UPI00190BA58D|nr:MULTISPECIES: hypothetical protein [unclassified Blastococcus]MBN1093469.1 hypothetical protein [Blastococcus sp. TML/M2B]MBN1096414.1 hypothetical protein [Blastococcus sp. TML/C7B]